MSTQSHSLTTVTRAFEILDLLWELDGAGPTAISEQLDIPDSTAYEYLRALAKTPYVVAENGTYSVSTYVMTMGGRMRHRSQLFHVAKDEMRRVATTTEELVGLTIEDDGMGIILHQEMGQRALHLGTYLGAATPLHTNASGKTILAFLPDARVREILAYRGLDKRTPHTITDPNRLRRELEIIRDQEFGVDWDEQVVGMGMVAVPIVVQDEILGSICIVTPTGRIQHSSYQEELIQYLEEVRQTIAINYQYGR